MAQPTHDFRQVACRLFSCNRATVREFAATCRFFKRRIQDSVRLPDNVRIRDELLQDPQGLADAASPPVRKPGDTTPSSGH